MIKYSNNKRSSSLGVGSSSILIIFVLLCIVTFAILSLVSANADKTLAEKNFLYAQSYFVAENKAEKNLTLIDTTLSDVFEKANNEKSYFSLAKKSLADIEGITVIEDENLYVDYSFDLNPKQKLVVNLQIIFPLENNGTYKILKWQVQKSSSWQPQEEINILK
ncbi:MAG: hypothetical protein RR806_00875 [Oscillospiraceae bacterium]